MNHSHSDSLQLSISRQQDSEQQKLVIISHLTDCDYADGETQTEEKFEDLQSELERKNAMIKELMKQNQFLQQQLNEQGIRKNMEMSWISSVERELKRGGLFEYGMSPSRQKLEPLKKSGKPFSEKFKHNPYGIYKLPEQFKK